MVKFFPPMSCRLAAGMWRPACALRVLQRAGGLAAVVLAGCAAAAPCGAGTGSSSPAAVAAPAMPMAADPAAEMAALGADTAVAGAVSRSCDDCHSTSREAAWNAKLAFSYWFPNHSLDAVNFGELAAYDAERRDKTLQAIAKAVEDGEMPPIDYRILHPSGKLTDAEKSAIVAWATAAAQPQTPANGAATPGSDVLRR